MDGNALPAGFQLDQPVPEAQGGLPAGFQLDGDDPNEAIVKNYQQTQEKWGGAGQQLATGLEGAAEAATFGLSTKAETMLGVDPESIVARRQANPGSHMAGQVLGLGASMLTGVGEGAILERVGAGVAKTIAAESTLAKIGSQAARFATENALFQSGDEMAKTFAGNPSESVGLSIAEAGLMGAVFGGGLGAVSPLWKATVGNKVSELLTAVQKKAGGIEGSLSTPIKEALDTVGVDIAPEVKAFLSDDPIAQQAAKVLEQSDTTKSGLAFQETLTKAKGDLAGSMVQSLGKDVKHVEGLTELSKYEAGKKIGDELANEVAERIDPLSKKFEELKGKVGDIDLVPDSVQEIPGIPDPQNLTGVTQPQRVKLAGTTSQLSEKISQLAIDQGWLAAADTPMANLVEFTQKNIGKQKTLKDLTNFISRVGEKADSLSTLTDFSPSRAGRLIKNILKEGEADLIAAKLGEKGPQLVEEFQAARKGWSEASRMVEAIEEQIGVKSSTSGYAKAIREMAKGDGEALLRRIGGSGNAEGLRMLSEQFPRAAEAFKTYHLDALLKDAASKAKPGEFINPKALLRGIEKMSPEMRAFVVPESALQKINAVGTLLEQFEKLPHNFSNTARTLEKLNQYIPGGAVAMTGALMGHGVLGLVAGPLVKILAKDAPDAVRLSMLKFMGSNQPLEAGAFKAMTDMARATLRGEAAATRAARGVFKSGSKVGPKREVSDNDRQKLDKQLLAYKEDPTKLFNVGGDTGHYLPDHGTAMAETAARAVNYLNSLRPDVDKRMPLDAKLPANAVQKAKFNRALDIAESPLLVLDHVKEGTLLPEDLVTLQNVAPGLYDRLKNKLNTEMIDHLSGDESVPYKTRIGLALFLGQPLDSTMTPAAIQSLQASSVPPQPQQAPNPKPSATSMQKLSKIGAETATPGQQRQMAKAKHV